MSPLRDSAVSGLFPAWPSGPQGPDVVRTVGQVRDVLVRVRVEQQRFGDGPDGDRPRLLTGLLGRMPGSGCQDGGQRISASAPRPARPAEETDLLGDLRKRLVANLEEGSSEEEPEPGLRA